MRNFPRYYGMSLDDDVKASVDSMNEGVREAAFKHGTPGVNEKLGALLVKMEQSDRFNRKVQWAILMVAVLTLLAAVLVPILVR